MDSMAVFVQLLKRRVMSKASAGSGSSAPERISSYDAIRTADTAAQPSRLSIIGAKFFYDGQPPKALAREVDRPFQVRFPSDALPQILDTTCLQRILPASAVSRI